MAGITIPAGNMAELRTVPPVIMEAIPAVAVRPRAGMAIIPVIMADAITVRPIITPLPRATVAAEYSRSRGECSSSKVAVADSPDKDGRRDRAAAAVELIV